MLSGDFMLQELQLLQSSNQEKVSIIDQSANSEEVKKALKKNPDISKERNNLLQGKSHSHYSIPCL